jgi:hypothetical protein
MDSLDKPNRTKVDGIRIFDGTTPRSARYRQKRIRILETRVRQMSDEGKEVIEFEDLIPSTLTLQGSFKGINFVNEELIKILQEPTGDILKIGCNFGELYNREYLKHLEKLKREQEEKEKIEPSSNRGRKKIEKVPKRKKQGNGKYFQSQITFIIWHPEIGRNYQIKLFHNGVFQVPGIQRPDMTDLIYPIKTLENYIRPYFEPGALLYKGPKKASELPHNKLKEAEKNAKVKTRPYGVSRKIAKKKVKPKAKFVDFYFSSSEDEEEPPVPKKKKKKVGKKKEKLHDELKSSDEPKPAKKSSNNKSKLAKKSKKNLTKPSPAKNQPKPGIFVHHFVAVMRNYKTRLINQRLHVDLDRLERLVQQEKGDPEGNLVASLAIKKVGCEKAEELIYEFIGPHHNYMGIAEITYNNDRCLSLTIKFHRPAPANPKKKITMKILRRGKINFDGGNSELEIRELFVWAKYIYTKYSEVLEDTDNIKNEYDSDSSVCSIDSIYDDDVGGLDEREAKKIGILISDPFENDE